jgi:quercetin dioxygenase-like cupin family protein
LAVLVTMALAFGSLQKPNSATARDFAARSSSADASGVIFLPKDQVTQTFGSTNNVLYDGNPERSYRVHAFHRDKPGEVEIHKKDTDILYVVEGSATFITGGTIAAGKETAAGEIRAGSMEGGTIRTLSKGDVIIIPANVPHWFKEIQQPILYFGVKVR